MTNVKFLFFLFLAALPWRAVAVQSVNLVWDANTSPNVAGYIIRYGTTSGDYTEMVPAGNATNATISGLVEGTTYFFIVTDYDRQGVESLPSNEFAYVIPELAPPSNPSITTDTSTGEAILNWIPNPSPTIAGYNVYWGFSSDQLFDPTPCYSMNQFLLPDLTPGTTIYIAVSAYDNDGNESAATTEIAYTYSTQPTDNSTPTVSAPILSLQPLPANGLTGVFSVTATGAVPVNWTLQASSDLQNWGTLTTGTDPAVNVTVAVSAKPKLFFRLNSDLPGAQAQTQTPTNSFSNSFSVNTSGAVMPDWNVQFSEDLQTWNPLTSGTGTALNMAVITSGAPSLFFRLKSQ